MQRYLATKHKNKHYVYDMIDKEHTELSKEEFITADMFLKILQMSDPETRGLRFDYEDEELSCTNSKGIDIDASYYTLFEIEYNIEISLCDTVNIYNLTTIDGDAVIRDSKNVNIYADYGEVYVVTDAKEEVNIIGLENKVERVTLTLNTHDTHIKPKEVMLRNMDVVDVIELEVAEGSECIKDYCFFSAEHKLKVDGIALDFMTETLCNHLKNSIEGKPEDEDDDEECKPELWISSGTFNVYIFDTKRTEIDLTFFTMSADSEWGYTVEFHTIFDGVTPKEPVQVIMKVDELYLEDNIYVEEGKLKYEIKCDSVYDVVIKIVDVKGNEVIRECKGSDEND